MRFEGARSRRVDGDRDLIVIGNDGHLGFQEPMIYQHAEGGRKNIQAASIAADQNGEAYIAAIRYERVLN